MSVINCLSCSDSFSSADDTLRRHVLHRACAWAGYVQHRVDELTEHERLLYEAVDAYLAPRQDGDR